MEACEQTSGMNMLQHGQMVHDFYLDLRDQIKNGSEARHPWKLPAWAGCSALWNALPSEETLAIYMIFHDCGKPYCRTVDEEGKAHFPDHAKMSETIWLESGGMPEAARLMGMDMDIHLLKGDDIEAFAARKEAAALLLAGLSEIHANAQMFGGIESTSFKMKWKHIDRRGKQIAKILSEKEGTNQ
jgi:hypothetical protein